MDERNGSASSVEVFGEENYSLADDQVLMKDEREELELINDPLKRSTYRNIRLQAIL